MIQSETSDRSSEVHLKAIADFIENFLIIYIFKNLILKLVYSSANKSPLFLKSECKSKHLTSAELRPTE
jgi:hypothetical protein